MFRLCVFGGSRYSHPYDLLWADMDVVPLDEISCAADANTRRALLCPGYRSARRPEAVTLADVLCPGYRSARRPEAVTRGT